MFLLQTVEEKLKCVVPIWLSNNHNQSLKESNEICKGRRKGALRKLYRVGWSGDDMNTGPETEIKSTVLLYRTKLEPFSYLLIFM